MAKYFWSPIDASVLEQSNLGMRRALRTLE